MHDIEKAAAATRDRPAVSDQSDHFDYSPLMNAAAGLMLWATRNLRKVPGPSRGLCTDSSLGTASMTATGAVAQMEAAADEIDDFSSLSGVR